MPTAEPVPGRWWIYRVQLPDCFGKETDAFIRPFDGVTALTVPGAGLAVLKK